MEYIIQYKSCIVRRGVEQWLARWAHNPEVAWFKSRPRNHSVNAEELLPFRIYF